MVEVGDRVELQHTDDPYTSLENGDEGVVTDIGSVPAEVAGVEKTQVWVDWDDGQTLALIQGRDRFRVIPDEDGE